MVDYGWDFLSRKVIWSLRQACYIALLRIREGYEEVDEIKKVEDLFNSSQKRGKQPYPGEGVPKDRNSMFDQAEETEKEAGQIA